MYKKENPNIVIFMADHYRGDMAPPFNNCYTPNLDRIYKDGGVSFTNAYCPSPHCCPSRATFHTGLYPTEHGVWNNVNVGNTLSRGLIDGITTWSTVLKEEGYKLYHSGKWHVSDEVGPEEFGWINIFGQKNYNGYTKHREAPNPYEWESYKNNNCYSSLKGEDPNAIRKPSQIIREGYPDFYLYGEKDLPYNDEKVTEAAENQLRECYKNSDEPFVLYCGCLGPHDPYYVPQKFLDMYNIEDIKLPESFYDEMEDKPNLYKRTKEKFSQLTENEYKEAIRHFKAFCTYEDYLFGRLLKVIDDADEYNNTVVIFMSDHGDYCGEHGLFAKGLPCFKGAYHVPLVMRYPNVTTKRSTRNIDKYITLADFAPSILDMTNTIYDKDKYSGKSFMPLINEDKNIEGEWKDEAYTQSNGNELYGIQRSVMTPEWKYVYNGFDYDELYNLKEDPNELINVARDQKNRQIIREMAKKLWQFAYDHKDTCINPYVMVSLAEFGPGIIFDK